MTIMDRVCAASKTPILTVLMDTPLAKYVVEVCGIGTHTVQRVVNKDATDKSKSTDFCFDVRSPNPKILEKNNNQANGKGAENQPPKSNDSMQNIQKITQWFYLYFNNPKGLETAFLSPIKICAPADSTEFQRSVWETLRDKVPFGTTVSYGELAALVNRPKAARAVGSTMKKNPDPILVPCHRVIKSTSEIGNYNGGSADSGIKRWLIDYEKHNL